MALIKWFLFFLATMRTEGLRELWKLDNFSVGERIMKTILESCYADDNSSKPIVLLGNFDEFINKSSIIRVNKSFAAEWRNHSVIFKASKIVIIEDFPKKMVADVKLLKEMKLWDYMAPLFIIGRNKGKCEKFLDSLILMWKINIINSIYICAGEMNTSILYTMNPIANYAPYPWKKMEHPANLNIFHQTFDSHISCKNLNYDKTKFLNGYEIKGVAWRMSHPIHFPWMVRKDYFGTLSKLRETKFTLFATVIRALNATGRLEVETTISAIGERIRNGTSDMMVDMSALYAFTGTSFLFTHHKNTMVAVIKSAPEISTLKKIYRLWSTPVLILAVVALVILSLVLIAKNHNVSLGTLNVIRLLTYTSILRIDGSNSFRIYLTTMLFFMIISNGVFQGKIAAFLTKPERDHNIETIDELVRLKYKMYTPLGSTSWVSKGCPKCDFKEVISGDCMNNVLFKPLHVCGIEKTWYESEFSNFDVEYVKEPLNEKFMNSKCRNNWPLRNRVNDMIVRIFESGLTKHWDREETYWPLRKRQARETEWSSPIPKPVTLHNLKFAFQLLAIGLSLATIVFFLELLQAKCRMF